MTIYICIDCVHFESLKGFIRSTGEIYKCEYCEQEAISIEDTSLFDYIKDRLENILCPVEELSEFEQAMIFGCGSDEPPVFEIWEFISDTYEIATEKVTEALLSWWSVELQMEEVDNNALYALDDGSLERNDYAGKWNSFVDGICHGQRYFNNNAETFLVSLLNIIQKEGELKPDFIRELESDATLYRARVRNNESQLKSVEDAPHKELGPVPKELASSQRMTPAGISAMYCALDRATCLSEIRPIVGDLVVSGEFRPISKLRLLDLTLLTSIPKLDIDPLDVDFRAQSHAREFLKDMTYKLSRPLSRGNELGYLSTQVFFEFLQSKYSDCIDGILFPSVQTGNNGDNVVLFPEYSTIAEGKSNTEQVNTNPFDEFIPKLFFVENSLRSHRINSVIVDATEEKQYYPLIADELAKRRVNI